MSTTPNWRAILKAYMAGVVGAESITYVREAKLEGAAAAALLEVEREVLAESPDYSSRREADPLAGWTDRWGHRWEWRRDDTGLLTERRCVGCGKEWGMEDTLGWSIPLGERKRCAGE